LSCAAISGGLFFVALQSKIRFGKQVKRGDECIIAVIAISEQMAKVAALLG
jgi:hypothetical protein